MIYAMSDFHLYNTTDKAMDKFGGIWVNHMKKIKDNWPLTENDTIIIPGDISWGLSQEEAAGDLSYIESLPGHKILLKGNHDPWWDSKKKLDKLLEPFPSIKYIHNDNILVENVHICGTRGWDVESLNESDIKIVRREAFRLETSILTCTDNKEKIVFMHYPPVTKNQKDTIFLDILKRYNIKNVYYGHLHGDAIKKAILGEFEGINFYEIAADQINFTPIVIKKEI